MVVEHCRCEVQIGACSDHQTETVGREAVVLSGLKFRALLPGSFGAPIVVMIDVVAGQRQVEEVTDRSDFRQRRGRGRRYFQERFIGFPDREPRLADGKAKQAVRVSFELR